MRQPALAGVRARRQRPARCVTTCCWPDRSLSLAWRSAARICAVSEAYSTVPLEAPALEGAAPDPQIAPASARWLAATLPTAYVPPPLLEELLEESLTQEAQTCVRAALHRVL